MTLRNIEIIIEPIDPEVQDIDFFGVRLEIFPDHVEIQSGTSNDFFSMSEDKPIAHFSAKELVALRDACNLALTFMQENH